MQIDFTYHNKSLTHTVGSNAFTYEYYNEGIRTSQAANGVKHTYTLSGSQIISEEWNGNVVVYLYDETALPAVCSSAIHP